MQIESFMGLLGQSLTIVIGVFLMLGIAGAVLGGLVWLYIKTGRLLAVHIHQAFHESRQEILARKLWKDVPEKNRTKAKVGG